MHKHRQCNGQFRVLSSTRRLPVFLLARISRIAYIIVPPPPPRVRSLPRIARRIVVLLLIPFRAVPAIFANI